MKVSENGILMSNKVLERIAYSLSHDDVDKLVKVAGTEYDARRVLSDESVAEIRELYANGASINRIRKDFNVAWHTVKRIVDDDYRKKVNTYRQQFNPTCGTYSTTKRRVSKKRALIADRKVSFVGVI